jgi:hypothetical protein
LIDRSKHSDHVLACQSILFRAGLVLHQTLYRHFVRDLFHESGSNGKPVIVHILKNIELIAALRYATLAINSIFFKIWTITITYRLSHFLIQSNAPIYLKYIAYTIPGLVYVKNKLTYFNRYWRCSIWKIWRYGYGWSYKLDNEYSVRIKETNKKAISYVQAFTCIEIIKTVHSLYHHGCNSNIRKQFVADHQTWSERNLKVETNTYLKKIIQNIHFSQFQDKLFFHILLKTPLF